MTAPPAVFDCAAAESELRRIADWWSRSIVDEHAGGFLGEIDHAGRPVANAGKGIVLNSRLLWFFSAMAGREDGDGFRGLADRAFAYIAGHFDDPNGGGPYWELARDG